MDGAIPSKLVGAGTVAVLLGALLTAAALAADEQSPEEGAASEDAIVEKPPHPWAPEGPDAPWQQPRLGIEVETIWPFLPGTHTVTIKVTGAVFRTNWFAGEVVGGVYLRPNVAHHVVEEIDEYMGTVGWRQYLWRGLHFETLLHLGWARGTNNLIDGKTYEDVSFMTEVNIGYRLDFIKPKPVGLFTISQGGFIAGLYTNIGPRDGVDLFPTGKFLVGVSFSEDMTYRDAARARKAARSEAD